ALKRFGCLGRVELFPEFDQAGLVARLICGFSPACGTQEAALFEAMTRGQNKFASWNEPPIDESIFEMFQGAVAGEKAWLEFSQSESSRNRLALFAEFGVKTPTAWHHRDSPAENS